ncbi:hypothetical protein CKO23_13580 [Thiocystis violacea]|nr:hypothetical protein [Thiocystis violacea]
MHRGRQEDTPRLRSSKATLAERQDGFTLIELMIALAVVAILAMLAFPSFQQQIRQARRADAHTALMKVAIAEEKLRANCPRYASQVTGTRGCATGAAASPSLGLSDMSPDGHYRLSLDGVSASAFRAIAVPLGDQANDKAAGIPCNPITLDQDGHRAPRECW